MHTQFSTFSSLGLSEATLQAIGKRGFETPTAIQSAAIPLLLASGKDLVGQAQTGTGKTAAFGIPLLETISLKGKHPQAVILVPTRELAVQTVQELNSLQEKHRLNILPVYGGQPIHGQIKALQKGIHILVGTPGRVLDHLNRGTLRTDNVSHVVLDEADEMLNRGFIEDIELILNDMPKERRTFLFSATMPKRILHLAGNYMGERDEISISQNVGDAHLTDQSAIVVHEQDKLEALTRLIDIHPEFYGLIFCRTKADTDRVAAALQAKGYAAEALHGDISQSQREAILKNFRDRNTAALVATDVASRGLDISDLTHVINYALPQDTDSYLHRIGRTGRAGKKGTAVSLVTPSEARKLSYYQHVLKLPIQHTKVPQISGVIAAKRETMQANIHKILQEQRHLKFLDIASSLAQQGDPVDIIASLLAHTSQDSLIASSYREIRHASGDSKHRGKKNNNRRYFAEKRKYHGKRTRRSKNSS